MSRAHIHTPSNVGERIADAVATAIGSWTFIIVQAVIMAIWVLVNTLAIFHVVRFDEYPFVFLNLAMSAEAAFSAPIIMQSQNRQAMRDRKRDDLEASEVEQLFSSHQLLLQINNQQLEILQLLRDGGVHEETKVCDDGQAQERSDSAIGRSGEDEGRKTSQANEVNISLTSYLAQMPDHPLARGIEQWITSLGKTLEDVSWWEICAKQLALHTWKAQTAVKFVGSPSTHADVFVYDERDVSK